MTAAWLLVLTFAIGIGSALTNPAWSAIVPELVPREDMVQAIALNGIGFNLTRAVGPALAGFLILLGGSSLTFSLYAVSITGGDQRAGVLAPRAALHRCAARALHLRDARWDALRAQHPGGPGGDGAHRLPIRSRPRRPGRCCRCMSGATWSSGRACMASSSA